MGVDGGLWGSMGVYGDVKLAKPNANIQEAMQELL